MRLTEGQIETARQRQIDTTRSNRETHKQQETQIYRETSRDGYEKLFHKVMGSKLGRNEESEN